MKTVKNIFGVVAVAVSAFLVMLIVTSLFAEQLQIVNPAEVAFKAFVLVAFVQAVALAFGYRPAKFAYMALLTEVWSQDIQDNLYMGNEFMKKATSHSMWVNHKTVHVPQAGAAPGVEKDRSVFPAAIGSRTDTELTYSLSQYTTDPVLLQNIEELQISYDKRKSILWNMQQKLAFVVATQTLYAWAPSGASRIVSTTGSTSTLNLPHSTATGSRKMTTISDVTRLKAILDSDNVPQTGRILLVPQYMYNTDILNISGIVQAYAFGSAVAPEGVVARLMGFDIMIRSEVLVYDNTGTPVIKAIDGDGTLSSPAATDQGAALAYHPDYVCHALGAITPYFNAGSNGNGLPEYFGSIFSAEVMHGASKLRTDQKGVVALVQGT